MKYYKRIDCGAWTEISVPAYATAMSLMNDYPWMAEGWALAKVDE